jgi:DNA-binding transcriptional LysR family regulator
MNLRWDDLQLFLTVYEQGSLSGAARVLQLGQPTLSRRISELEQNVGEPLFVRQSQGMLLTAAGLKLLPAVQRMAEWATEAADRKSTRLNSSHRLTSRMPSSA